MNKKKLYLFTDGYPYGKGEKSFIEPELDFLLEEYEVTIVSKPDTRQEYTPLKKEIKLFNLSNKILRGYRVRSKLKFLLGLRHIFWWKEIKIILQCKGNIRGKLLESIRMYYDAECYYQQIKETKMIDLDCECILYTYWFKEKCLGLLLHKKYFPNAKIISRIHGYDLYDERTQYGRQPFKSYMNEQIDQLIFVSENARQYYECRHNLIGNKKFQLSRLGVHNKYNIANYSKKPMFRLVSCSNLYDIKRVHLIIEALSNIDCVKIEWIHFGDGKERGYLEQLARNLLAKKNNIKYEFKGHIYHQEIMKYYYENQVDCFITTSETEGGAPVSIQEALSFGMPIIGTSVGDIPFMIEGNGILLTENPSVDEITDAIKKIVEFSERNLLKMRYISRKIWENNFQAEKNYRDFLEILD